uniref:Uncharacterized protein n=1 Tax=Plectus sambesii TaxID=2011161 RepID=A0A914VVJ3_9BILA
MALDTTKDFLLAADTRWPFPLLQLAHQLLVLTDSYKAADVIDPKSVWKSFNATGMDSFVNATVAFGNNLEKLDISLNELFTKFDLELRKIYEINASKFDEMNGTLVEKIINVQQMTFVSETRVCYRLPLNNYSFNSVNEYILIRVDSSRVPSVRFSCNEYYCIYTGPVDKITIDIPGRDTGAIAGGQLPFSVEVLQVVNTQLAIRTVIESLPVVKSVEKCSKTTMLEECKVHCRLKAMEEQCNCSPESTSALQPLQEIREKYGSGHSFSHNDPQKKLM